MVLPNELYIWMEKEQEQLEEELENHDDRLVEIQKHKAALQYDIEDLENEEEATRAEIANIKVLLKQIEELM